MIREVYGCWWLRYFKWFYNQEINALVVYPFFILYKLKTPLKKTVKHEWIHIGQMRKIGYLRFLFYYIREYFRNRRQGLSRWKAYKNISFEKEARVRAK